MPGRGYRPDAASPHVVPSFVTSAHTRPYAEAQMRLGEKATVVAAPRLQHAGTSFTDGPSAHRQFTPDGPGRTAPPVVPPLANLFLLLHPVSLPSARTFLETRRLPMPVLPLRVDLPDCLLLMMIGSPRGDPPAQHTDALTSVTQSKRCLTDTPHVPSPAVPLSIRVASRPEQVSS